MRTRTMCSGLLTVLWIGCVNGPADEPGRAQVAAALSEAPLAPWQPGEMLWDGPVKAVAHVTVVVAPGAVDVYGVDVASGELRFGREVSFADYASLRDELIKQLTAIEAELGELDIGVLELHYESAALPGEGADAGAGSGLRSIRVCVPPTEPLPADPILPGSFQVTLAWMLEESMAHWGLASRLDKLGQCELQPAP